MPKTKPPADARKQLLKEIRLQYEQMIPPGTGEEPGTSHVVVVNPPAIKRFNSLEADFLKANNGTVAQRQRAYADLYGDVMREATRRAWTKAHTPGFRKLSALFDELEVLARK